jgi:hypothetical protein
MQDALTAVGKATLVLHNVAKKYKLGGYGKYSIIGDCHIAPVCAFIPPLVPVKTKSGCFSIGKYKVAGGKMYHKGRERFLLVEDEVTVKHREHGALKVGKGLYRIALTKGWD